MAKLTTGELVLSLNEGQLLEGYNFVYVGVNILDHSIVLTPSNTDKVIVIEDPILGEHEEKPHAVTVTNEGYVIEVNGLTNYIAATDEYSAEVGKPIMRGVVVPPHIILSLPAPEYEDENEYDYEPESLEDLEGMLDGLDLDELREYAERLGITLIKSDWRQTIISKIKTWWKKEWKRLAS